VCPICGNVVAQEVLERGGIEAEEIQHIKRLVQDGTIVDMVKLGELVSKQLNPERLSVDFEVQNSLEALSKKAEELLRRQGEHIEKIAEFERQEKKELLKGQSEQFEKITELERQDKKDVREEAVQEQHQILEDYQKKLVELQGPD
jgi:hypothetical protein